MLLAHDALIGTDGLKWQAVLSSMVESSSKTQVVVPAFSSVLGLLIDVL